MSTRLSRMYLAGAVSSADGATRCGEASDRNGAATLFSFGLRLKSDEELMFRLAEGEADCLTILFRRHSALVFRIAHRLLRNASEAEDASQQAFLDVYRAAAQFDAQKGSFKTWLLMFVYHRTFNRLRQLRATGYYETDTLEDALPQLFEGAGRSYTFSPSEAAVIVRQSLALIQPRQRRTIELVYYEGLTAEEVASRTGESVRVVRHNLYRGMAKLREILRSHEEKAAATRHRSERRGER